MSYSIDVNGNDNQPEWGYCTVPDCGEEAFPIWTSGEYPDDPDLYLCPTHIGARILELEKELTAARDVVIAARRALDAPLFEHRAPLVKAIADYDWAVQKARAE